MLILRRAPESWLTITHAPSGDTLRVGVGFVTDRGGGRCDLLFDGPRLFVVERDERKPKEDAPCPA